MKKILEVLVSIGLLVVLLSPIAASAIVTAAPETCTLKYDLSGVNATCTSGAVVSITDYGMCCLLNTIYNVTNWIFVVLVGVVTIFVIIGAFTIVTAAGSPEKLNSGRSYIMYAAIGLIVAFLAKAIPGIVKIIVGIT
jgi:hypothetical protein